MKNRKTVVVAFLLCAVLLLGVGYAALTDTLDITGSADVNVTELEKEYEVDIYFNETCTVSNTVDTASRNADNVDKASFSAKSLLKANDTASFTFTIMNDSDHEVVVTPKLSDTLGNTNPDWFSITSDWGGQPQTIAAQGSKTYTVTVMLKDDPTSAISGSFLIELVAVANNDK